MLTAVWYILHTSHPPKVHPSSENRSPSKTVPAKILFMRKPLTNNLVFQIIVLALILCLPARQTLNAAFSANPAAKHPLSLAEELFRRASDMNQALHGRPLEERGAGDYLRLLDAYNQVVRLNTDNYFSAESLAKRAELQREMADVTGDSALYQQAIETFRQILTQHPHSAFVGDALINIAEIYEENLQDLDGAVAAYKELVAYFPASVMAREARAVITRFEAQLGNRSVDVVAAKRLNANGEVVGAAPDVSQLTNVRNFSGPDYARVVIDLSKDAAFTPTKIGGNRLSIRLEDSAIAPSLFGRRFIVGDTHLLKRITVQESGAANSSASEAHSSSKAGVQIEIEIGESSEYTAFKLANPDRIVVDIHAANSVAKSRPGVDSAPKEKAPEGEVEAPVAKPAAQPVDAIAKNATPARPKLEGSEAVAKANKANSSNRQQPIMGLPEINEPIVPHNPNAARPANPADAQAGAIASTIDAKVASGTSVKCVVIDAGHGGHDTGTISGNGMREKDLTLDVARRLRGYIKRTYGDIEVVMTRDGDYFVALEQRTAIANARHADLFISVHANSSQSKVASGVETYFVSPDKAKTNEPATQEPKQAAKTIAEFAAEKTQAITASVTIGNRVAESRELARYIQSGLVRGIGAASPRTAANRGVKHAGFVVLMGAAMPSVLAEVSFLSNPKDEALLQTSQFRERIAASLFAGLNAYLKKNRPAETKTK
jgi:N-acetylmuramoyl-L-alanine amidase